MEKSVLEQLRERIGMPAAPDGIARDPVNLPTIRRWCDAMGEANPIYLDAQQAARYGLPGVVAPPAMLDTWQMPAYSPLLGAATPGVEALEMLAASGFTEHVATNIEQKYIRLLPEGEIVTSRSILAGVSDQKHTALGTGHFVTFNYSYANQQGELLGTAILRAFKYRPDGRKASSPPLEAPWQADGEPTGRLDPGSTLPEMIFPVTASAIIAGALATGDFQPVHHDIAVAQAGGLPNIFMNILTSNGILQRYISDLAGPGHRITGVALRLGVPNIAGDTMRLNGRVVANSPTDGIIVEVSARNSLGEHASASISLVPLALV